MSVTSESPSKNHKSKNFWVHLEIHADCLYWGSLFSRPRVGSGTQSWVEERSQVEEVTPKHWDQEIFYYVTSICLFSHRKPVWLGILFLNVFLKRIHMLFNI